MALKSNEKPIHSRIDFQVQSDTPNSSYLLSISRLLLTFASSKSKASKRERKKKKKRERERPKVGNNNGQLRIATPPRVAHAKPPGPKVIKRDSTCTPEPK